MIKGQYFRRETEQRCLTGDPYSKRETEQRYQTGDPNGSVVPLAGILCQFWFDSFSLLFLLLWPAGREELKEAGAQPRTHSPLPELPGSDWDQGRGKSMNSTREEQSQRILWKEPASLKIWNSGQKGCTRSKAFWQFGKEVPNSKSRVFSDTRNFIWFPVWKSPPLSELSSRGAKIRAWISNGFPFSSVVKGHGRAYQIVRAYQVVRIWENVRRKTEGAIAMVQW